MQKVIVVALAALVLTACAGAGVDNGSGSSAPAAQPPAGAAPPQTAARTVPKACDIITPAEIAQALQVPDVKKDDVNSGENTTTHVDICNWYVKSGSTEGVQVQVYRGEGAGLDASLAAYSSAKGDAVEHDSTRAAQAQQLTGIGDEAIYSPYPVGKGGNIAFRTRAGAVTITGSASRDRLESIAKLAASRM
jgi:hypothetical protein